MEHKFLFVQIDQSIELSVILFIYIKFVTFLRTLHYTIQNM
jgi:hypothetical protein